MKFLRTKNHPLLLSLCCLAIGTLFALTNVRHRRALHLQPTHLLTVNSFNSPEFGVSFDYPSDMALGNLEQGTSTMYIEFCSLVSCGMAASEFLIIGNTDSGSVFDIEFDYARGWRAPYGLPTVIASSSMERTFGRNTWLTRNVHYSDGQIFTWHQMLKNKTLVSFVLPPQESYTDIILSSVRLSK